MDKKAKIAGLIGLSAIGYYLYSTKDKDVSNHQIKGLNVNINPELLVNGGLEMIKLNPLLKSQIKNGLAGLMSELKKK